MSFHSVDPTSGELWQIAGLKNTAANMIPYSNTISGLQSNKVQGAIDELAAQNQTLETALDGKINTTDIANNLTTTAAGKVLDARQGKTLNDSISATNSQMQTLTEQVSTKAEQSLLAPIQTTLVASKPYTIGEQFVYQGLLYKATAAISQGGTITIDGNCSLSDDVTTQIDKISKTETVTLSNLSGYYNSFSGIKRNKIVNFSVSTKDSLPASTWITIGQMDVAPEIGQTFVGLIATGAGNTAIINITGSGGMQIFASVSGAFNASGSFICK